LVRNLTELLDQYDLRKKYYICEGWRCKFECHDNNLKICGELWTSWYGGKFPRHLFLPCIVQNILIWDIKQNVSIKSTQFNLQKCITWSKFKKKDKHEWSKDCIDFRICPKN
jgi:hypothetical protein